MPSNAALTSPGRATAERASLEALLTSLMLRGLDVFLVDVEKAAAGESVVGEDPFTLGAVQERWDDFVDWVMNFAQQVHDNPNVTNITAGAWAPRNKRTILLTDAPGGGVATLTRASYLTAMRERLRSSPLPQEAYDATRRVLVEGRAENWSQRRTIERLEQTLHRGAPVGVASVEELEALLNPVSGRKPKIDSYEAMVRRIARTEATTLYNYTALTRLADSGARGKRWVAHHDGRTRFSHMQADGEVEFLADPFTVGGYSLMVPGDPNAPHSETANCRCVIMDASIEELPVVEGANETGPLEWQDVEVGDYDDYGEPILTMERLKRPKPVPLAYQQAEMEAVNRYLPDTGHWALAQRLRGYQNGWDHPPRYYPVQKASWNTPKLPPAPEPDPFDVLMAQMSGRAIPRPPAPPVYGTGMTAQIRALDAYIQRLQTEGRTVVFRGFVEYDQPITPGSIFRDRMYTSVTVDPAWAERFARMRAGEDANSLGLINPNPDRPIVKGTPVIARIVLPNGTTIGPGDPGIKELILARDSRFRVLSEEVQDGLKILTMEKLP